MGQQYTSLKATNETKKWTKPIQNWKAALVLA
jgi:hypothetical protein